ncbi:hypothetical protein BU15DRAFT_69333, partial [Melanogaster broomeanus]
MTTEESPLLAPAHNDEPVAAGRRLRHRFGSAQKKYILFVVSIAGLLPTKIVFVSGTFVPSIPQVSKDMHSTDAAVRLSVAQEDFRSALAVLLGPALAPLAGVWGLLQFLLIYFSLPETSHLHHKDVTESTAYKGARLVWINPFTCLGLLRSPNLFAI